MTTTRTQILGSAAGAAGLAAAICMAAAQLIGLVISPGTLADNLLFGLALTCITFWGTFAIAYAIAASRHPRRAPEVTTT